MGKAQVLVARVSVRIGCKDIDGMKYTFRDYHIRDIGQGIVKNELPSIPSEQTVLVDELSR